MAGKFLGGAGGIMGAMALVKILSATTGRGSTLAKIAGTLLGRSGGGKGSGSGFGRGSGKGDGRGNSDGSLAESLLDAVKELKKGGTEGGSGGSGRRQGKGRQSASNASAPQTSGVESRADEPVLNTDTDADQLALATLAEHITSFVDGRARVRHAGLASSEAASALQTLLAANGLAAFFSPRGASVLITYDASRLDKSGFLLRALPLGRYLRDCDAALEARA